MPSEIDGVTMGNERIAYKLTGFFNTAMGQGSECERVRITGGCHRPLSAGLENFHQSESIPVPFYVTSSELDFFQGLHLPLLWLHVSKKKHIYTIDDDCFVGFY